MLKPKNAKSARIQHTINQQSKMPKSFTTYSEDEVRLLRYLEDYQVTFTELYRHRRPLFLTPRNECGVKKFVCTTVRALFSAVPLFSKLNNIFFGYFDPENISLDDKNKYVPGWPNRYFGWKISTGSCSRQCLYFQHSCPWPVRRTVTYAYVLGRGRTPDVLNLRVPIP